MLAGWKTLAFNSVMAVLGVFIAMDPNTIAQNPKIAGYIVLGQSVIGMILRTVTSTPVGGPPKP